MNTHNDLPVAVIGAGPVGLAAAAHLLNRGIEPLIFEAGDGVGASVREWGHVRVFSPWDYNVDPVAEQLLDAAGWTAPDPEGYPTGAEIVERYLEPLAALPVIADRLHLAARVVGVGKQGLDKLKDAGRDEAPFELVVEEDGEERALSRACGDRCLGDVDAHRTHSAPADCRPLGERAHADRIAYGIPDVLGADRERFAGRRVLVVGSGHSAFNAILDLVALRDSEPATQIVWAIRGAAPGRKYGGGGDDQLPARGALGNAVRGLVEDGSVALNSGFHTRSVTTTPAGRVALSDGERELVADEVIAATGFRPDLCDARRAATGPRRPRRGGA